MSLDCLTGMYGYDNNLCGASVSYVSNGTPYGYVVLDFSTDCIVTEYVIEEGAHNICDAILENAGVEISVRANIEQTAKIYRTTPFNYAVSLEVNGVKSFYDSQKGNISIQEFNAERDIYDAGKQSRTFTLRLENWWATIFKISTASALLLADAGLWSM